MYWFSHSIAHHHQAHPLSPPIPPRRYIIDYNRQSLDNVVQEGSFRLVDRVFRATGWDVITMK